jgi:predicted DNA-binding protein YlxM (UPF0122 family)
MWKESDIKKIITRLKKNKSVDSVANAFNVSKGSIYALIKSRGYDLHSLKNQLPTPDKRVQEYEMRQNAKAMKKQLKLKKIQERKERILAIQQKEKIERTKRLIRLADLWRQGLTCQEIGKLEGGLTRSRISQLLQKYNKEFPENQVLQNKRIRSKNTERKKRTPSKKQFQNKKLNKK